jgi:DNA repair protein RecO (recombination protein O)
MEVRARGIACRVRRFAETSVIVQWITEDAGRVSTLAKGAGRPKSPFAGRLDLLVEADISYVASRRSELHTLREVEVIGRCEKVAAEFAALQLAACAIHELELATEPDTPLEGIFPLFKDFLSSLNRDGAKPRLILAWEARLLEIMGFDPAEEAASLSSDSLVLLQELSSLPWDELASIAPSGSAVREVTGFLGRRFENHFGRMPKGREDVFPRAR